jgi:putative copper resistance protein D
MGITAWDLAAVLIKSVTYGTTFVAAGGLLFLVYSRRLIATDQERRISRWLCCCTLAALVLSLVRISVLAGFTGESFADMLSVATMKLVLNSGEARATGLRVIGLSLLATALFSHRRRAGLALVGALVAVVSFAGIGHAWATGRAGLVGVLTVHVVCAAFWLGALPPLWLIARDGEHSILASVAGRFGRIAAWVVALLILAGATLGAVFLGSPAELWTSGYGRLLALKIAAVAVLLALAARNKLRVTPRLQAGDVAGVQVLHKSIEFEMLLGALILIVTATFTTVAGPTVLD